MGVAAFSLSTTVVSKETRLSLDKPLLMSLSESPLLDETAGEARAMMGEEPDAEDCELEDFRADFLPDGMKAVEEDCGGLIGVCFIRSGVATLVRSECSTDAEDFFLFKPSPSSFSWDFLNSPAALAFRASSSRKR